MALETWNGSVWVTVTVGTSPIPATTGAARAAIATASSVGGSACSGGDERVGPEHEVGSGVGHGLHRRQVVRRARLPARAEFDRDVRVCAHVLPNHPIVADHSRSAVGGVAAGGVGKSRRTRSSRASAGSRSGSRRCGRRRRRRTTRRRAWRPGRWRRAAASTSSTRSRPRPADRRPPGRGRPPSGPRSSRRPCASTARGARRPARAPSRRWGPGSSGRRRRRGWRASPRRRPWSSPRSSAGRPRAGSPAHRERAQAAHQRAVAVGELGRIGGEGHLRAGGEQRPDRLLALDAGELGAEAVVQAVAERGVPAPRRGRPAAPRRSGNRSGSRLAAASERITTAPAGITTPAYSTSCAANRAGVLCTGESKRRNSSTAAGSSSGRRAQQRRAGRGG